MDVGNESIVNTALCNFRTYGTYIGKGLRHEYLLYLILKLIVGLTEAADEIWILQMRN